MIRLQTPDGPKTYVLRGIQSPRGKKNVARVSVLDGGVDRTVWDLSSSGGDFEATVFPAVITGAAAVNGVTSVTTSEATASQSGATGSVTYSWAKTAGADSWTIERPRGAVTRFTATAVGATASQSATFTCTITDQAGRSATADVNVEVTNYGGLTDVSE